MTCQDRPVVACLCAVTERVVLLGLFSRSEKGGKRAGKTHRRGDETDSALLPWSDFMLKAIITADVVFDFLLEHLDAQTSLLDLPAQTALVLFQPADLEYVQQILLLLLQGTQRVLERSDGGALGFVDL